jgi:hypothetical protein
MMLPNDRAINPEPGRARARTGYPGINSWGPRMKICAIRHLSFAQMTNDKIEAISIDTSPTPVTVTIK